MDDQPTTDAGMSPSDADQTSVASLRNAMRSMRGYAPFALLSEIHRIATKKFGFTGSITAAARLLESESDISVQHDGPSQETRVYHDAWHWQHDIKGNAPREDTR